MWWKRFIMITFLVILTNFCFYCSWWRMQDLTEPHKKGHIWLRSLNPVQKTGKSFNMGAMSIVIYNTMILHPSRISYTSNSVTVYENIWVAIKPRTSSLLWQMEYSGVPISVIINISVFLLETLLIVYCISVNHIIVSIK